LPDLAKGNSFSRLNSGNGVLGAHISHWHHGRRREVKEIESQVSSGLNQIPEVYIWVRIHRVIHIINECSIGGDGPGANVVVNSVAFILVGVLFAEVKAENNVDYNLGILTHFLAASVDRSLNIDSIDSASIY
jgi:hypothetical protein